MHIIGGILLIVGGVLFFVRLNTLKRLRSIQSARVSTTGEIKTIATAVAEEIGAGSWEDYVKVQGQIACEQPVRSQLKQVECVYYSAQVIRKYEEVVTQTGDDGKTLTKTERKSETLSSQSQSTPFGLTDATGRIEVNPDRAEIETVEILSEFKPEAPGASSVSFGGLSLSLDRAKPVKGRTLGYQYIESILPLNREVLVIGMATDAPSKLTICNPSDSDQKFIISLKSAGQLTQNATKASQQMFYGMLGCFSLGAVLLVASAF